MIPVLLLLGSNIEPESHLPKAREEISTILEDCRFSPTYLTQPVGELDQPPFWNQAVTGSTASPLEELQNRLADLELAHGRQRDPRRPCGPRTLDLDILLFGQVIGELGKLLLPSPLLHRQAFAIIPAAELAPHWRHPLLGKTLAQLAQKVDRTGITPLPEAKDD